MKQTLPPQIKDLTGAELCVHGLSPYGPNPAFLTAIWVLMYFGSVVAG